MINLPVQVRTSMAQPAATPLFGIWVYLDHGHLQHVQGGRVEEHVIEVSEMNPDRCSPEHKARGHESTHQHGPDCGHEAVPHGNHIDYLVDGRLHHSHGDHCDDHGPLPVVSQ
jgi:hypothetical protein